MHPSIVRRISYPLHERLLARPTFAYLEELERSQWLDSGEVEALQLRKLRALLTLAARHSPWHAARMREARLVPEALVECTLAEFRRLPTMSKADIRGRTEEVAWRDSPDGAYLYNTGGSTGEPLIFYFGRRRQASDAAGRMRARRWWGVDVGDREVYVWGAPVELQRTDRVKVLRDRLLNQLVLNAFAMSPGAMTEYVDAINAFGPRCIYGYASSLALLAAHARERRMAIRTPGLRVVCTTGEPLLAFQRTLLEEVFGVPVANEFGSRDIGFTAHEDPEGEMLLMSESVLLEVLDENGQPVPPGESGEAVMTGLCSQAQPFIRYRTGDMVRMAAAPGRGGRGLHVISEVTGRTTDFLVRPDGTMMHALAAIYVLRETPGIAHFKIVQHSLREVEACIVPDVGWNPASIERVRDGLRARFGPGVEIGVSLLDEIPPGRSGKHRYVESAVSSSFPVSSRVA